MLISRSQYRNSGAALIVSLIILMVMSLLGISALRNTILEQRMTVNAADIAFATLFLCSHSSPWISARVLTVSSGGQELD